MAFQNVPNTMLALLYVPVPEYSKRHGPERRSAERSREHLAFFRCTVTVFLPGAGHLTAGAGTGMWVRLVGPDPTVSYGCAIQL